MSNIKKSRSQNETWLTSSELWKLVTVWTYKQFSNIGFGEIVVVRPEWICLIAKINICNFVLFAFMWVFCSSNLLTGYHNIQSNYLGWLSYCHSAIQLVLASLSTKCYCVDFGLSIHTVACLQTESLPDTCTLCPLLTCLSISYRFSHILSSMIAIR